VRNNLKILAPIVIVGAFLCGLVWWKLQPVKIVAVDYSALTNWKETALSTSFETFKNSCAAFLKQSPETEVGTENFPMKAADWQPACQAALKLKAVDEAGLHVFFVKLFKMVPISQHKPRAWRFTGYYLPVFHGAWQPSERYKYPIWGRPQELITVNLESFGITADKKSITGRLAGQKLVPYFNRAEINQGKMPNTSAPLLWVDNRVDRFFLEIQGSGYVDMEDGTKIAVGYAAQNGRPYTSIGKYLVQQGELEKKAVSMQSIREFLNAHAERIDEVLNQNESFIFFRILNQQQILGSQGVALTAGYSLAVDKSHIPLGTPIWLETSFPCQDSAQDTPLKRLMIAQDTGGAIKGWVRGDVFWGGGEEASYIAGHMNNKGTFWLLLPRSIHIKHIGERQH
jgi:membrane-bound lytic murein transglycosylase A